MDIAALILDFDGTIFDTETPIFEEWAEEYRRYGPDGLRCQRPRSATSASPGIERCQEQRALDDGQEDADGVGGAVGGAEAEQDELEREKESRSTAR